MSKKAYLFIISYVTVNLCFSQGIGITKIRMGFDPIKSVTMLAPEKENSNNRFYFNTWEANAEIAGPYRTSLIMEYGFTRAHVQDYYGNLDYKSKGNYLKIGLDFNINDDDIDTELDLGWRFGMNSYNESAQVKLNGEFYENSRIAKLPQAERTLVWGEILMSYKVRILKRLNHLNNFWLGTDLRLKFMNSLPVMEGYPSMNIPGYGLPNSFCGGAAFKLCYQFDIRRSPSISVNYKHKKRFSREQYRHNRL